MLVTLMWRRRLSYRTALTARSHGRLAVLYAVDRRVGQSGRRNRRSQEGEADFSASDEARRAEERSEADPTIRRVEPCKETIRSNPV